MSCSASHEIVVSSFVVQLICYANIITLLTLSLTLTYLTTKVPNFMQGTFAMVGVYAAAIVLTLLGNKLPLYASLALAFVVAGIAGAIVGLATYYLIIRPLILRNASTLMLMIATFTGDFILCGILYMISDILVNYGLTYIIGFVFLNCQFALGLSGPLLLSTLSVVGLYLLLYIILYRTKFGVSVRAAVENPALAQTIGVNLEMVRLFSWILSGIVSAFAGVIWPLLPSGINLKDPTYGSTQLPLIFAAFIIGGIESLAGSVIGGYIVGFSQLLLTRLTGSTVYGFAFPLIVMAIFLLICPRGIGELIDKLVIYRKSLKKA